MSKFLSVAKYIFAYMAYGLAVAWLLGSVLSIYIGFTAAPLTEGDLAADCQTKVETGQYADVESCIDAVPLIANSSEGVAGLMAVFCVFVALIFYVIGRLIMGKKKKDTAA